MSSRNFNIGEYILWDNEKLQITGIENNKKYVTTNIENGKKQIIPITAIDNGIPDLDIPAAVGLSLGTKTPIIRRRIGGRKTRRNTKRKSLKRRKSNRRR